MRKENNNGVEIKTRKLKRRNYEIVLNERKAEERWDTIRK